MTLKKWIGIRDVSRKRVTTIISLAVILGIATVGCGEKNVVTEPVSTTKEETEKLVVTKPPEITEVSEADKEKEGEEVTLDELNTRLAELVIKYEGTPFIEADIKKVLAEANNSFMSEETLFSFLGITSYEELEPFAYGEELYNNSMKNIEEKKKNPEYELVVFDVGDLFFDEILIETGHFISKRIHDVASEDQEKSMAAARDLVFYYTGCLPEGAVVEKAPITRDNKILDSSAGLYINGFYGYAIAILCREEIELEQSDSMKNVCGMWEYYDQTYEFFFLLAEKGIVELK